MKFFNRKKEPPPEKVPDNKTLLRLARKYIDEKNMRAALKCCRKVLRKSKQNYMALVLLGKSLQKSENAPKTYERATKIKPDKLLAWQGLANYYEGKNDILSKTKLISVYEKILTLDVDDDYSTKTLHKYAQLASEIKKSDTISKLIVYISVQEKPNLKKTAQKQLMQLLESKVPIISEDLPALINVLKKINNTDLRDHNSQILLGKLILHNNENDFPAAIRHVIEMESFCSNITIKQWLCRLLCKTFVKHDSFCGFDIDNYIDELTSGIEATRSGGTLIAIMFYRQRHFLEAYQKCSSVVQMAPDIDKTEALFLLNCSIMYNNISQTENLLHIFLRKEKLNDPEFVITMYTKLLSCYIENRKCYQAICIVKKIPIEEMDSVMLSDMGTLYFESEVNNSVVMDILDSTDYYDLYKAFDLMKRGRFSQAISVLQMYDKHAVKFYYLATVYWQLNLHVECLENLGRAVSLMPDHPKVHYYLGIYYYRQECNVEESRIHFEKSYSLYSKDTNVIKMLSMVYEKLELQDLELKLLLTAYNKTETKKFWVCSRLGLLYFAKGETERGLSLLEEAIRLNPQDIAAHEWMGDIYFRTEAYDLAIAAYQKVVDFNYDTISNIKCLNKIASVYTQQTFYDRAIFTYESILQMDRDDVPALKGLIENRIMNGRKKCSRHLYQAAREEVQYGFDRITSAMSRGIRDRIYYHLFADTLVFFTRLPNDYSYVTIQNAGEELRIGKIAMYEMAINSFSKLVKYRDSHALFKCAYTYLEYYIETKKVTFWQTSYNLSVLSIKASPTTWFYWDLLGKICYFSDKYKLAHYSFFKSINLNGDVTANQVWCNLGTLYLKLNKPRLASHCFAVGRKCLPQYPQAWIGDGLLAEIIQEDGNVGIFSPGPNADYEVLSEIDFLDWAMYIHELAIAPNEPSFELPVDSFHYVPNAVDIIEWYFTFEEDTTWGCYTLAQFQENKELLNSALHYYERAHTTAIGDLRDEIQFRKARVLMKMRRYTEAADSYGAVDNVNLFSMCAVAFAQYKGEDYETSLSTYNNALRDFCQNDDDKVEVLVAMSNVAYMLDGLTSGVQLLQEAEQLTPGPIRERGIDLPFLKSYAFGKVNVELIAYVMADGLRSHVNDAMWWYYMGLNYLKGPEEYAKLASFCVRRAIVLSLETDNCTEIGKMHAIVSVAEFYSGDRDEALEYARLALYVYPSQPELWAALILCVYSHPEWSYRETWIPTVLQQLRENIYLPPSIIDWLSDLETKLMSVDSNQQ